MFFNRFFEEYFCFNRKFLIYNLILRNLKIRYRKSILGMVWTVLIPAGTAVIFYAVLKHVMKVNQHNHFVLILASQIAWVFFASSISSGLEQIVNNFSLFNKVPMPPQSIVLADSLTLVMNLVLSIPVLLVAIAFLGPVPNIWFLQYFVLLGFLALVSYALALLLSLLYVYFRDLKPLMSLILQLWFYLTPVLYTVDMFPPDYRWILAINPIGELFVALQMSVRGEPVGVYQWLCVVGWTVGLVIASAVLLRRVRNEVVEIA